MEKHQVAYGALNPNPFNIKDVVGWTEIKATKALEVNGYKVRIMHKDGENFVGTCDLRMDRVNLSIADGKVFKASIG